MATRRCVAEICFNKQLNDIRIHNATHSEDDGDVVLGKADNNDGGRGWSSSSGEVDGIEAGFQSEAWHVEQWVLKTM